MRRRINHLLWIILFTFFILFSYGRFQEKLPDFSIQKFIHMFSNESIQNRIEENKEKQNAQNRALERSIWISYLEWNAFSRSASENSEKEFRNFFEKILSRCQDCHITNLIVQVRPFSDAIYPSDYFPWATCISGKQGRALDYDPLALMVEMTHEKQMTIEAWINPYRISYGDAPNTLAKNHPARKWAADSKTKRNVLQYEDAYYYNPSSAQVQKLIVDGVAEIIEHYAVDGIHMDDYFYPEFNENNVMTAFDAKEYKQGVKNGTIAGNVSIADWRRENVNQLVRSIYHTIKDYNPEICFGISPQGNPANLESDYTNYVDIRRWLSESGYIDYIMPQIYWGFQHETAPFQEMVEQWVQLAEKGTVELKIGLQLYRMGTAEQNQSDYAELQKPSLISKQIKCLKSYPEVNGYCLFSYQYLATDETEMPFDSYEFSEERKQILQEITKILQQ